MAFYFIKALQWQALDLEVKNGIKQYNPPLLNKSII